MNRRPLTLLAVLLAALALFAAGCGGDDSGSATGEATAAGVVPKDALAYVAVNADLDSEQWEKTKELAGRFPDHERLQALILRELSSEGVDWERDVEPAVGPEVAFVGIRDAQGEPTLVVLTQPDDEAKLDALLEKGDEPSVRREIEGWQAVAETAAELDAYERALERGALADDDTFEEAMADLSGEALVKAYVNGAAVGDAVEELEEAAGSFGLRDLQWVSMGVEARDDGVLVEGGMRGGEASSSVTSYTPELLELVPADVLALMSWKGAGQALEQLRSQPQVQEALPEFERMLGVSLDDLGALLDGESALYVRQGAPIPEVTLLATPSDLDAATRTLDRLAQRATALGPDVRTGSASVDGTDLRYVEVQGMRIHYGAWDGKLVVTSGAAALRDLAGDGPRVESDEEFQAAREAVGAGDETAGLFYVDLERAVALIMGFAGLSGESVPTELGRNLAPLRTLVANGEKDGDTVRYSSFLRIE